MKFRARVVLVTVLGGAMGGCGGGGGGSSTPPPPPPISFSGVLGDTGCPMAHCSQRLDGNTNLSAPSAFKPLAGVEQPTTPGSGYGLGCASNGSLVACALAGTASGTGNVVVYDANGKIKFSDRTLILQGKTAYSAPVVFDDGTVLAVNDQRIALFAAGAPDGLLGWVQQPANLGNPVSPTIISTKVMLMATNCPAFTTAPTPGTPPPCTVSTWDMSRIPGAAGVTQQPLDLQHLYDGSDPSRFTNGNNGFYETLNTPTVDLQGPNGVPRVYIEGSAVCFPAQANASSCGLLAPRQGQIFAFDVDPATGKMMPVTGGSYPHFYYPGPSGASPVLVKNGAGHAQLFFDGLTYSSTSAAADCHASNPTQAPVPNGQPETGCFYGVVDDGTQLTELWNQRYPSAEFQSAATVDPRGGMWIVPLLTLSPNNCSAAVSADTTPYGNCLIHVSVSDGSVMTAAGGAEDKIDPGLLFNGGPPVSGYYGVTGAPTVMSVAGGGVALAFGARLLPTGGSNNYVMLADISTTGAPRSLMGANGPLQLPPSNGLHFNFAAGQFPAVDTGQGTRIVFTSTYSGPLFVGD